MGLTAAFAIAKDRHTLLIAHYNKSASNSRRFLTRSFVDTDYTPHAETLLLCLRDVFCQRYTDFYDESLITEANVTFALDKTIDSSDARVEITGPANIKVTVTLGLIIFFDILLASRLVYVGELDPSVPTPEPAFKSICSVTLLRLLRSHSLPTIPTVLDSRLANFFLRPSDFACDYWIKGTTLALLWVLSHEVGHFLCGHVGYYREECGLGVSERYDETMVQKGGTNLGGVLRQSSELMADIYATIRISLILCEETKAKHWPETLTETLAAIMTAGVMPVVTFLLGRERKERVPEDILNDAYPSEWCRIFNVFATTAFIADPMLNTEFFDFRKNPLQEAWRQLFRMPNWRFLFVEILDGFDSLCHMLAEMKVFPRMVAPDIEARERFAGSLEGARYGVTAFSPKASTPDEMYLLQWMYVMKDLCTNLNLRFAAYLSDAWKTGERGRQWDNESIREDLKQMFGLDDLTTAPWATHLTSDPAYKIMDDWMSNICVFWGNNQDVFGDRWEGCHKLGAYIVDLQRRMS